METTVLVLNPGSSSREYALYEEGNLLVSGYYEHDGHRFKLTSTTNEDTQSKSIFEDDFNDSLAHFLKLCGSEFSVESSSINGIGIRLVAPGRRHMKHAKIDDELYQYLKHNIDKAPLHIGIAIEQIDQVYKHLPGVPAYMISDSEFHKTLSHEARNYAISREDAHNFDIYRFGYHGISVKSIVHTLRDELNIDYSRVIVCHLGSGASITAIKDWKSIETSMGYSPLEGLVMATRAGNIDVEAAIELKKRLNFDDHQLTDYLNNHSGLLGLSQSSNDIRELLETEKNGDQNAKLALSSMVYRIQSYIGAYIAILGGLDAIVFTATVGERSAILRDRICKPLAHLGLDIDTEFNSKIDSERAIISKRDSPVTLFVIPSDEAGEMARQTASLLKN